MKNKESNRKQPVFNTARTYQSHSWSAKRIAFIGFQDNQKLGDRLSAAHYFGK